MRLQTSPPGADAAWTPSTERTSRTSEGPQLADSPPLAAVGAKQTARRPPVRASAGTQTDAPWSPTGPPRGIAHWRCALWVLPGVPQAAVQNEEPFIHAFATPLCKEVFCRLVDHARERVEVLAFTVDDQDILQAVLRALRRGVQVYLLVDGHQSLHGSGPRQPPFLHSCARLGAEVRVLWLRDPENGFPRLHAKSAVFDKTVLWAGSFNFTRQSSHNLDVAVVTDAVPSVTEVRRVFRSAWVDGIAWERASAPGAVPRLLMPESPERGSTRHPARYYGDRGES